MRPLRAISKRSMRALSWMLPLILMLVVTAHAVGPNFPPLTGRVVDDAGILSPSTIENLTGLLAQHEQATGEQVVVVTIKSLQGYAIEDFGYQLGRYWGIGQKDKNTGTILIIAPDDHKARIEVGYGLEGKLTDALSHTIIENDILPNFRRGDFNAGVTAGTKSILAVLGGGSPVGSESDDNSNASPSGIGTAALFLLFVIVLLLRSAFHRPTSIYRRVGRGYGFGGYPGDEDKARELFGKQCRAAGNSFTVELGAPR